MFVGWEIVKKINDSLTITTYIASFPTCKKKYRHNNAHETLGIFYFSQW